MIYKFKNRLVLLPILLGIFCLLFILLKYTSSARAEIKSPLYSIVYVYDGDTFSIREGSNIKTIRMMGIDTPETVDPRKSVQCYGKEASSETKRLLYGNKVRLSFDKEKIDKYGRYLAYVYTENGLFLNEYLLQNGFAREYTYNKPYKFQKDFKKIEKKSKDSGIGMWNKEKCNTLK